MLQLTDDQQIAYNSIINTFKTKNMFLLTGSAGTGKTELTKTIANHYTNLGYNLCCVSPTHQAKRIISAVLNTNKLIPVNAVTVASLLGKIREHSYVGTQSYSTPNHKKFNAYNLFILDEVSMVSNKDLKFIITYMTKLNKKLLIIGDSFQIPCVSAGYVVTKDTAIIEKENSYIFTDTSINKFELKEVVRQVKDSPILKLACFVRDHIEEEFDIEYEYIVSYEEAYQKFVEFYNINPYSCKMIAYTNQSVRTHNMEIRRYLGYEEKLVRNDLLTGYTNLGWPELIIENSRNYVIINLNKTTNHQIDKYPFLSGTFVDLNIINTTIKIPRLFFINISDESNLDFINELIRRAEKVNQNKSTKMDFINYNALKTKVIFMEDLYKFNEVIYAESDFKEKHALLFTKLDEVIKDYQIVESVLTDKINTTYDDVIGIRLLDDKIISDSETLADRYKMIEKDIYYGYSATSHKMQGSSIDSVIVDDNDFKKIKDRFNYQYDKLEKKTKEKNQLRYVAYTRASHNLYIVSN